MNEKYYEVTIKKYFPKNKFKTDDQIIRELTLLLVDKLIQNQDIRIITRQSIHHHHGTDISITIEI